MLCCLTSLSPKREFSSPFSLLFSSSMTEGGRFCTCTWGDAANPQNQLLNPWLGCATPKIHHIIPTRSSCRHGAQNSLREQKKGRFRKFFPQAGDVLLPSTTWAGSVSPDCPQSFWPLSALPWEQLLPINNIMETIPPQREKLEPL